MDNQLTPESFKQRVLSANPSAASGVASDGTKYSDMDATDFTKRMVSKYPEAVTKDGHKYSEFLPKSPVEQSKSFGEKALDVGKDFAKSVMSPFVGAAAIPTQLLAKALGQPDPFANKALGGIDVSNLEGGVGKAIEKKAGDIAQVGSYLVSGEGLLGAAGMGALQGAGSAMSQGKGAGEVALNGAGGALIGGGATGATKLAGIGINKLGQNLSGEGINKATQGIKDAYSSALNLNASERGFEHRSGKDLADVLMKNNTPLGRNENGTLDASSAIDKLQTTLAPLNDKVQEILSNPQGVVKNITLDDIMSRVENRIKKLNINPTEQKASVNALKQNIADTAESFGTEVDPKNADKIKQLFQGSAFKKGLTSSDQLQSNVSYLISDELRKATEESIAGTDAGNVLGKLNMERSDLVDAIKRLTNLDGTRILKGGRLGNLAGGVVGSIAGMASGLGVPGAIAGDYFGTKAAEFLNNPATKIAVAQGKAKMAGFVPNLLGKTAEPIGTAISKVGNVVKKSARGAGLVANALTK